MFINLLFFDMFWRNRDVQLAEESVPRKDGLGTTVVWGVSQGCKAAKTVQNMESIYILILWPSGSDALPRSGMITVNCTAPFTSVRNYV
jgi:hypothetical protein